MTPAVEGLDLGEDDGEGLFLEFEGGTAEEVGIPVDEGDLMGGSLMIQAETQGRKYPDDERFLFFADNPAPTPAPMPIARIAVIRKIMSQNMRGFSPNTRVWSAAVPW